MLVTFNLSIVIEASTAEESIIQAEGLAVQLRNSLHVNEVILEPLKTVKPTIEDVKCPDCGGKMASRKGKFGVFWGCLSYPKCTGTRDSEGRSRDERQAEKDKVNEQQEIKQNERYPFRKN